MAPATKRAAASSPSASSLLKEHGASSSSIDVVNGTPVRERKAARTGLPSVEGLSEKTYVKAAQGSISLTAEFIVRKVAAFPTNPNRLRLSIVGLAGANPQVAVLFIDEKVKEALGPALCNGAHLLIADAHCKLGEPYGDYHKRDLVVSGTPGPNNVGVYPVITVMPRQTTQLTFRLNGVKIGDILKMPGAITNKAFIGVVAKVGEVVNKKVVLYFIAPSLALGTALVIEVYVPETGVALGQVYDVVGVSRLNEGEAGKPIQVFKMIAGFVLNRLDGRLVDVFEGEAAKEAGKYLSSKFVGTPEYLTRVAALKDCEPVVSAGAGSPEVGVRVTTCVPPSPVAMVDLF